MSAGIAPPGRPAAAEIPMKFDQTSIPGCYRITCPVHEDRRGRLVKAFQESRFARQRLAIDLKEMFWTVSGENVLRGMHVQLPNPQTSPGGQAKLSYCAAGSTMNVVLDLRVGSPMFGKHDVVELSAEAGDACYMPPGVAHGFCVRRAPVVMVYCVTTEFSAELDACILWNSIGAPWPTQNPVLSDRDATSQRLEDFRSPFRFAPGR